MVIDKIETSSVPSDSTSGKVHLRHRSLDLDLTHSCLQHNNRHYRPSSAKTTPVTMAPHATSLDVAVDDAMLFQPAGNCLVNLASGNRTCTAKDRNLPRILCIKCHQLSFDSRLVISYSLSVEELADYAPLSTSKAVRTPQTAEGLVWPCSVCGSFITLYRTGKVRSFGQHSDHSDQQRSPVEHNAFKPGSSARASRRKKLKRKMSKVHKSLLNTLGVTPKAPSPEETGSDESIRDEFYQSTSTLSVTQPAAECSTTSIRSSEDYETCRVTEYNDANGKYLVIEQAAVIAEDEADSIGPEVDKTKSFTSRGSQDSTSSLSTFPVANEDARLHAVSPQLRHFAKTPGSSKGSTASDPESPSSSSAARWPKFNAQSANQSCPAFNDMTFESAKASVAPTNENKSAGGSTSTIASYKPGTETLYLPLNQEDVSTASVKKNSRKKKRTGSLISVLSPSYKQKNDDLHKFFKDLPDSERLLGDHTCALMRDILYQGRLYVSQNFVCFHSKILRKQTTVSINFKDIESLTKEKTVKVIPNAIQFQTKSHKYTFTSFTARDKVFQQLFKLWEDARQNKPMSAQALWNIVHDEYGHDLGPSSDDEAQKGKLSIDSPDRNDERYSFTSNKATRKKKPSPRNDTPIPVSDTSSSAMNGKREIARRLSSITNQSNADDKSSSRGSFDNQDTFQDDEDSSDAAEDEQSERGEDEADLGPAGHAISDLKRVYMEQTFSVSVDHMFDTIYGENNPFWKDHLGQKARDLTITSWAEGSGQHEGHKVRILEYELILSNPLGPKSSQVHETQIWHGTSAPGKCYAVDCVAKMLGVTYGDYFTTVMRFCMRRLSKSSCELRVSAGLNFVKTPFSLVKTFIEKNCYSGIEENFRHFGAKLDAHFERESAARQEEPRSPSPSKDLPRTGPSVSATSGIRRRKRATPTDPAKVSRSASDISRTSLPNGKVSARSYSSGSTAVPHFPLPSPTHDVKSEKSEPIRSTTREQQSFSRRWRNSAFVFVAVLLLLGNLSMYQRLNLLEQGQEHKPSETVGWFGTKDLTSVLHFRDPSSPNALADELQKLKSRVNRLESTLDSHVTSTEKRWRELASNWKELDRKVDLILSKLQSSNNRG